MGILGLWHVPVRSKPLSFFYLSSVFELNQEFSALYNSLFVTGQILRNLSVDLRYLMLSEDCALLLQ